MPRKSKSKGDKSFNVECPTVPFPIYCPPAPVPEPCLPCHEKKPCPKPLFQSDVPDNLLGIDKRPTGTEEKLVDMLGALGGQDKRKETEKRGEKKDCLEVKACAPCGVPAVACPAAQDPNIALRALVRAAFLLTNLTTATARDTQRCLLQEALGLLCPTASVVEGTPASDWGADINNMYLEINCFCPTLGTALGNVIALATGAPPATARVAPPEGCPTGTTPGNLSACSAGASGPCTALAGADGSLRISLKG